MFVPLAYLLILALLQGLLEFLPVSSEGQLLLVAVNILGIDSETALSIAFWLHLGTAVAVIIFYNQDIFEPIYQKCRQAVWSNEVTCSESKQLFGPLFTFVMVGTLGTAVVALPLYLLLRIFVSQVMGEVVSALVGVLLIITGIVLYFQRKTSGIRVLADIPLKEAFLLGLVQGVAVLPGISRSGITLTWLLLRNIEREEALRLSFLLGVPSVFGIISLDILQGEVYWSEPHILGLITFVSLIIGIVVLAGLRASATRAPFWAFCLGLGSLVLLLEIPAIFTLAVMPPT